MKTLLLTGLVAGTAFSPQLTTASNKKTDKNKRPNVVFIIADDLGYGDLSCYGQEKFKTPNIDKLAQEGLRFTQCYSGTTVSAPSRSSLITGLHTGHTPIRGNKEVQPEGQFALPAGTQTLFSIFKQAGYTTEVLPVTTEEYGLSKAARPFNSRLDKSKLVENGFKPLPTWQDALSRYLKEIEY